MHIRLRHAAAMLAAVALATVAACSRSDAPTAARSQAVGAAPVSQELLGLGLFSCQTPSYGSVTKTIGPEGGVIAVGPHSLVVPPQALARPVSITATAPKGSNVRVDFEPHGLQFARSAALTLSYKHCLLPPLTPSIVYVDGNLRILELVPSLGSTLTRQVVGKIDHFSGYIVAD